MIKVEVIEDFTLERFNELKNITRKSIAKKGKLFKGDNFECDEKMVDYLTGNNPLNKVVVKVIEVEPKLNEFGNPVGTRELKEEQPKSNKNKKHSKK